MDFQTKSSFCKDHLYQIPLVCKYIIHLINVFMPQFWYFGTKYCSVCLGSADIECRTCRTIGDLANLMTCVTCGAHYHGTCVGLAQLPGT